MAFKPSKVYAAILFSDVERSSQIAPDDDKILKLEKIYDQIDENILTDDSCFFSFTDGDAFKIYSFSCADLADIALRMRDEIRRTNWKKLGLLGGPAIRIALHFQQVQLRYKKNVNSLQLHKIVGSGLITAARIEPIVESNQVICTKTFLNHLKEEKNVIQARLIGLRELAKNFGQMELYQLFWDSEDMKDPVNPLKIVQSKPPQFLGQKSRSLYLDIAKTVSSIQNNCQSFNPTSIDHSAFEELISRLNSLLQNLLNEYRPTDPLKMAIQLHVERINTITHLLETIIAEIYPGLDNHKYNALITKLLENCEELVLTVDYLESALEKKN